MRRPALALAALALVIAAAGCGAEGTTRALPVTVVGTLPKATPIPKGDAAAGKILFTTNGCGGCHTYAPAGTSGKIGPDLARIAADSKQANDGTPQKYAFDSIKNPGGYVVPGYNNVMPDFSSLGDKKIADLVAFVLPQR
jgi:cytochrome c551/c552